MNKYTFTDLLQKKCFDFSKIEIPLIQRDYVQGQKSDDGSGKINKTGFRFIKAIFDSLEKSIHMDMDFIYGSVDKDKKFIPLDGQQRLTTLFLLHWYFANKSFTNDTKQLDEKLSMLSNFSYETRISSREFCLDLCKMKKCFNSDEKPSDYIRNESWFFSKFNLDPTVSAMLNMLDEIHKLDKEANIDYEKLDLLKFNILNMENFGLTEELYLKMNARGKLLTEFEKIKAELEKKAADSKWEDSVNEKDKFYFKADREWTDLFWRNFKKSADDAFLNFIAEIVIIQLTLQIRNLDGEEGKKCIARIQKIAENAENLTTDDIDKETFEELKKLLDLYSLNSNEKKRAKINLWDFCKEDKTIFETICKGDDSTEVTYQVRGLFFAQNLYLAMADFSQDNFDDWMRVIRNIAKNATIDSVQTFKGFLGLIQELSAGCNDICSYLSTHEVQSNFARVQVKEEIYKAKVITKNERTKSVFAELEENSFCMGKLYFAFYCCGVDLQNLNEKENDLDLEIFKKVKSVFDSQFSKKDISDDFRVLLFTCGDNRFYEYWWSWSYKTETNKRCCIENTDGLKWYFSRPETENRFKNNLKEAVLKLCDGATISKLLSEYECPPEMPKWEKWIIKNLKEFSEHCSGHYFGITGNNKTCYLYEGRKRPNDRKDCFKIPED